MAESRSHEGNRAMRVAALLLVGVAVTLLLGVNLAARMTMADVGEDGARVAAFSFDLADGEGSRVVSLGGIEKPGDKKTYTFSVSNGGEVSVRYRFGLELDGSMPVACDVLPGASGTGTPVLTTGVAELDQAVKAGKTPFVKYGDPAGVIPPNTPARQVYTLVVEWPASENDLDYANDSVAEVTLRAVGEQVD